MTTPHDPTRSFSPLDAVIAEYVQAVEAGQAPDRAALIALHPEMAGSLLAFFDDLDRMDRVASPLRMANDGKTSAEPGAGPSSTSPLVRYFGDYELLAEIARGGMGVVYKARQVSLNRVVALKMVLAGTFASSQDVQRFRIEAEAAANLDHPQIVPIHEVGEHEGQQYFSMKLVEGTSLAAHPRGPAREEVLGLLGVARAVHHAHQHGVLHRDLKPSNVLVDLDGHRLVTDFGLAKRLSDVDGSLTETGQLLGTPRYMSPEQALGRKDLTVTADVYSLGVILFERLTGRTPFLADNVVSLLHQVRESEPPRLSSITPGLGRDLETIVGKCLDKIPSRRYPTAEALALDLENWLEGRPIAARPVGPPARAWRWCRRNPAVAALMATVAASLIAGTIVSIAFALRADARAVEAGISATRSKILIAQNLTTDANYDHETNAAIGLLTYARTFRQVPEHRSADDLRWFISANLAIIGQQFHKLLPPLEGEEIAIKVSAPSPDGRTFAALSPDGRLRLWDLVSGRLKVTFREDRPAVRSLQFSPDGRFIATIQQGSNDGLDSVATYGGMGMQIPADSPDGGRFQMRLWDIEAHSEGRSIDLGEGFNGVLFSPGGRHIVVSYHVFNGGALNPIRDTRSVLWDTREGRKIAEFVDHISMVSPSFTPDGRTLLLSRLGETTVVDTENGRLRYRINPETSVM